MIDQDELERQELVAMLRNGEIAQFNERRKQHSYRRVDLSRADLVFIDLTGAVLQEADLAESQLSGANLCEANLKGAYLSSADLTGVDMGRADMAGADLTGADLSGSSLVGANLQQANLSDALLPGTNLTGANLRDADLRRADLRNIVLAGAELMNANLDAVHAEPDDLQNIARAFEDNADRAISAGRFIEALVLYDQSDRFLLNASAAVRRIALYRKINRLAASLELTRDQLNSRGRGLMLWLSKSASEALVAGDEARARQVEKLHELLGRELGFDVEAPPPERPAAEATRTDLSRHSAAAARMYDRFDVDTLFTRLGEVIDVMDDNTVLDLSVRFAIPDLQLRRAREALTVTENELDRLRGENFVKILQQRFKGVICVEGGEVHQAWLRGELAAAAVLVDVFHRALPLPPPFKLCIPLVSVLFVKLGLSSYCGWQAEISHL